MESKMINQTLLNNWNQDAGEFSVRFYKIVPDATAYHNNHPYFFLKRELEVGAESWKEAKACGEIRHCKIYRGKFLDYVVHKEFNTIEEWVADAGGTMEDVLFGTNRVHKQMYSYETGMLTTGTPKYITLDVLLRALGYVEPPKVQIPEMNVATRDLTNMMDLVMGMHGLSIRNVYVANEGDVLPWKTFMEIE